MHSTERVWIGIALVLAILVACPLALAQDEPAGTGETVNVLITVRIHKIEGDKPAPIKSYSLVVADGTSGSKLLAGQRVPFPTAGEDGEMDGFVYQNIGFVIEARARLVGKKTVMLIADIEDSRVSEGEDGGPPIVETRQLAINALLDDGVPLELTRVEGREEATGYVEVEARILR